DAPRMDIAIAALITSFVQGLYNGLWASYEEQRTVDEVRMHKIFVDCLAGGSDAQLDDEAYLSIFGMKPAISAQSFWQEIYKKLEPFYGRQLSPFSSEIQTLLGSGCLANRILRRLNMQPGEVGVPD